MNLDELIENIDPDRGYARWLKVGNALFHAGASFETWDRWSSGSAKYSMAYARMRWDDFKGEPAVGIEALEELAAEGDSVRRAPWVKKLWACTNEAELRAVAADIQSELTIDAGDRVLLAKELQKAWRLRLGEEPRIKIIRQMIQPITRGRSDSAVAKAQKLFQQCLGHFGVTPEVVSVKHMLPVLSHVLGRQVTLVEVRRNLLLLGFHKYGIVRWREDNIRAYTVFRMERSEENSAEIREILDSYQ